MTKSLSDTLCENKYIKDGVKVAKDERNQIRQDISFGPLYASKNDSHTLTPYTEHVSSVLLNKLIY